MKLKMNISQLKASFNSLFKKIEKQYFQTKLKLSKMLICNKKNKKEFRYFLKVMQILLKSQNSKKTSVIQTGKYSNSLRMKKIKLIKIKSM